MLVPTHCVLHALNNEFAKLQTLFADSNVDGSVATAIANGLQLLLTRESGGSAAMMSRFDRLDAVLVGINDILGNAAADIRRELADIRRALGEVRCRQALSELEQGWHEAIVHMQTLITKLNAEKSAPAAAKKAVGRILTAWEANELQAQIAMGQHGESATESININHDKLTAYLRNRFSEPNLQVTSLEPVAGGFGKETMLFEVDGKSLSGSFVMRRDMGSRPSVVKDCKMIRDEYPVIKAMFKRGFPAPDALWLDTEHTLLPGGDFIVMRRSPGRQAGSFFGARTEIPASLTASLADVMARLHTLPPMIELGDLTDSIRVDLWNLSRRDCIERYIRGWYEVYLREEHTPSPALIAIYGWLLDNVPERMGAPILLHGDIGFHNFLFDNSKLSAVLDWEFAHIGDPAEELGMVKVTVGSKIDWNQLMERYIERGGDPVDEATLHYFQVWAYARNATACSFKSTLFVNGHANDLKLAILPVVYYPKFIGGAQALIDATS